LVAALNPFALPAQREIKEVLHSTASIIPLKVERCITIAALIGNDGGGAKRCFCEHKTIYFEEFHCCVAPCWCREMYRCLWHSSRPLRLRRLRLRHQYLLIS
jgi:hypothetical protein